MQLQLNAETIGYVTIVFFAILAFYYALQFFLGQFYRYDLSGRPILITGCDTGLGHALASHLHASGVRVIAACLTEEGKRNLIASSSATATSPASTPRTSIRKLEVIQLDVTNDESIAQCSAYVTTHCPQGLYALINNAGVMTAGSLVECTTLSAYQRMMDVNWGGTLSMCKALLPALKKARIQEQMPGVRIVNVGSFLGKVGPFSMSGYCSSKYAVEGFTDCLRQEMAGFGIHVVLVEPGAMNTHMAKQMKVGALQGWEQAAPALREEYGEDYPRALKRSAWLLDLLARDVKHVLPTIQEALASVIPAHRYTSGLDAWLFVKVAELLPSWLNDFACLFILGRPSPAAAANRLNKKHN